jgi:hypothetical protein
MHTMDMTHDEPTTIDTALLDEVTGGFVPVPDGVFRAGKWLWDKVTGGSPNHPPAGGSGGPAR